MEGREGTGVVCRCATVGGAAGRGGGSGGGASRCGAGGIAGWIGEGILCLCGQCTGGAATGRATGEAPLGGEH